MVMAKRRLLLVAVPLCMILVLSLAGGFLTVPSISDSTSPRYSMIFPQASVGINSPLLPHPPSPKLISARGNFSFGFNGPEGIAVDPINGYVYVASDGANAVDIVDPKTSSIISSILIGGPPTQMAYDPANGNMYALSNSFISVINGTRNAVVANITAGCNLGFMAVNPVFGVVYAASYDGYVLVINGSTNTVQSNITLASWPVWMGGIAVDTVNGNLYAVNQQSESVIVLNGSTDKVESTIHLGGSLFNIAFDPMNNHIYVAGTVNISAVNVTTGKILANITLFNQPYGMAFNTASGDMYVSSQNANYISLVSTKSNVEVKEIHTGSLYTTVGTFICYDGANSRLYISNPLDSDVLVVNGSTNQFLTSISPGTFPVDLAVDTINDNLYVTSGALDTVKVVNGSTGANVTSIDVGSSSGSMAFDSGNGKLFVANSGAPVITIINTDNNTVESTISFSQNAESVLYDNLTGNVYVMNGILNKISILNGSTNVLSDGVNVFQGPGVLAVPYQATIDTLNNRLYFTSAGSDKVSSLNLTSMVQMDVIQAQNDVQGIAFDSYNGYIYVADSGTNNVTIIDGHTDSVLGNISVGKYPAAVAFDSHNGYIFVVNTGSDNISVIDGATNKVVANVPVGYAPQDIAFDGCNGFLDVVNYFSNNITQIGYPSFHAYFNESGLSTGSWHVRITGAEVEVSGPIAGSQEFNLPDGEYSFTVWTNNTLFSPDPASGNFSVSGQPLHFEIDFKPVHTQSSALIYVYFLVGIILGATVTTWVELNLRKKR